MPPTVSSTSDAVHVQNASRQVSKPSVQQPVKVNGMARPAKSSQVSRGSRLGNPMSASIHRPLVGRNSPEVGNQQKLQALTSGLEEYRDHHYAQENKLYGNGWCGDKESVRLDDLESVDKPDGKLSLIACKWNRDPRLRVKDLGKQIYDSRVRSNGVVVFDCGHTSPPTREPRHPPPVTWHRFDDTGFPVPFQHLCHDCDCHERFIAQKTVIEVNQLPLKILRLNERIAAIAKEKGLWRTENISNVPEIAELQDQLHQIITTRDKLVWEIWGGWERKWGEELLMNEFGYVYGPNPVVKGLEFVFPPEVRGSCKRRPRRVYS